jgi:hypothetical protein
MEYLHTCLQHPLLLSKIMTHLGGPADVQALRTALSGSVLDIPTCVWEDAELHCRKTFLVNDLQVAAWDTSLGSAVVSALKFLRDGQTPTWPGRWRQGAFRAAIPVGGNGLAWGGYIYADCVWPLYGSTFPLPTGACVQLRASDRSGTVLMSRAVGAEENGVVHCEVHSATRTFATKALEPLWKLCPSGEVQVLGRTSRGTSNLYMMCIMEATCGNPSPKP